MEQVPLWATNVAMPHASPAQFVNFPALMHLVSLLSKLWDESGVFKQKN